MKMYFQQNDEMSCRRAGRPFSYSQMKKQFRLIGISSTTNSFGLRGHVFLSRDGHAFEAARSDGNHARQFEAHKDYDFEISNTAIHGAPPDGLAKDSFEIPRALPAPPEKVLRAVFKKISP